jgi:hypothetical protein
MISRKNKILLNNLFFFLLNKKINKYRKKTIFIIDHHASLPVNDVERDRLKVEMQ